MNAKIICQNVLLDWIMGLLDNWIISLGGCSSVRLERLPVEEDVEGSNPFSHPLKKPRKDLVGLGEKECWDIQRIECPIFIKINREETL